MKPYSCNVRSYFGSLSQSVTPADWRGYPAHEVTRHTPWHEISSQVKAHSCLALRQVHGTNGYHYTHPGIALPPIGTIEADYVTTCVANVALCVLTADCVPLFLYASDAHALAAIHAGWRGATSGIVQTALSALKTRYGGQTCNVHAFIGPCIHAESYCVTRDFYDRTPYDAHDYISQPKPRDTYHFDLLGYITSLLTRHGVPPQNCLSTDSCDTYAHPNYASYRRAPHDPRRNISAASLTTRI